MSLEYLLLVNLFQGFIQLLLPTVHSLKKDIKQKINYNIFSVTQNSYYLLCILILFKTLCKQQGWKACQGHLWKVGPFKAAGLLVRVERRVPVLQWSFKLHSKLERNFQQELPDVTWLYPSQELWGW